MDELAGRLAATMPPPTRASIVHNDLKLDNCQFDPTDPDRVRSIFDWDMTTLGEPLVDLGTLLNYWPDPSDDPMGLPARGEIIDRYAERTGLDVSSAEWYEAFAKWKTAVVIQQLHRRWERGESTDPRMETIADRLPQLAETASNLLDRAVSQRPAAMSASSCFMREISTCWSDSTCWASWNTAGSWPPSLRGEQRLHHRHRALVVADHVLQEELVERPPGRRLEMGELVLGQHAGHHLGRPVALVVVGNRLASLRQPGLQLDQLVTLGDGHPLGHERQVLTLRRGSSTSAVIVSACW